MSPAVNTRTIWEIFHVPQTLTELCVAGTDDEYSIFLAPEDLSNSFGKVVFAFADVTDLDTDELLANQKRCPEPGRDFHAGWVWSERVS